MPRVRLTSRPKVERTGINWVGKRSSALDAALVASGAPGLVPMYDTYRGSHADRLFKQAVMESGFKEMDCARWPCEQAFVSGVTGEVFRESNESVYRLPGGALARLEVSYGWAHLDVAGGSPERIGEAMAMFQALYPATFLSATDDRVPITFWSLGPLGPSQRLRMIDAQPWEAVRENYPPSIHGELDGLMQGFEPGKGGLLLLWQGPPGTGKTWALRALVSEWRPWAEFHFITDPDAFFVENASYMIDVLLADSYGAIEPDSGAVYEEADPLGKWRVLILEDTGELLSAQAKEKYGQGLSRLLNVVDGMIGQGLRVLVLVTTNDELGELNAAVRRPGRCASQLVFPPFSMEEATVWMSENTDLKFPKAGGPMTLAEMYGDGMRSDAEDALADGEEAIGPVEEIRQVAEAVQEDAAGYGETAWDAKTKTVFWIGGDWSDSEAAGEKFLAIDGVEGFVSEAEGVPDGWFDAEIVYPDSPPLWLTQPPDSEEAAQADLVALASQPLDLG